jgi:methyl-accepting chemotaxis protein
MATSEEQAIKDFARRGLWTWLGWVLPAGCVIAYLLSMILGLSGQKALLATAITLPVIVVTVGLAYPYLCLRMLAGRAFRTRAGDRPGARLNRILRLPWRAAAFCNPPTWIVGGSAFSLILMKVWLGMDPLRLALSTIILACFGVVMVVPTGLLFEKLLQPYALEEQKKHPTLAPQGSGPFWPRQAWFLPLTYVSSVLSLLIICGCVVVSKTTGLQSALAEQLGTEQARVLEGTLRNVLLQEFGFTVLGVCALLLVLPAITYWLLARRQAQGTASIGTALEGLATGTVVPPNWVSTDELGDLAAGMNAVLEKLRQLPLHLHNSATRLLSASQHLSTANLDQQQSLARQASALQQAQVTAQEIKQTSMTAADRAESVLSVARRAEELGVHGEVTIGQTLSGLSSILDMVNEMQGKLERLAQSASQIGNITLTVKSMADRSNMLALNAAIEAVRSGEHGKGFGVVAKEIRTLANQSVEATVRIQGVLDEVTRAIQETASMGEKGVRQISTGLDKLQQSGDSLRELSRMTQENAAAVRQIAMAVTQQNQGFQQIFGAIHDLSQNMDSTLVRLQSTQEAAQTLQAVSNQVTEMARQYGVREAPAAASTPE